MAFQQLSPQQLMQLQRSQNVNIRNMDQNQQLQLSFQNQNPGMGLSQRQNLRQSMPQQIVLIRPPHQMLNGAQNNLQMVGNFRPQIQNIQRQHFLTPRQILTRPSSASDEQMLHFRPMGNSSSIQVPQQMLTRPESAPQSRIVEQNQEHPLNSGDTANNEQTAEHDLKRHIQRQTPHELSGNSQSQMHFQPTSDETQQHDQQQHDQPQQHHQLQHDQPQQHHQLQQYHHHQQQQYQQQQQQQQQQQHQQHQHQQHQQQQHHQQQRQLHHQQQQHQTHDHQPQEQLPQKQTSQQQFQLHVLQQMPQAHQPVLESRAQFDLQSEEKKLSKLMETLEKVKVTLTCHADSVKKCTQQLAASRGSAEQPSLAPSTSDQPAKRPDPIGSNGELAEVKRKHKTIVKCKVAFQKIGEIDTLHDRFVASVIVKSKWREPEFDSCHDIKSEGINWNCYWGPKLFIENALGDQQGQVTTSLTFDSEGRAVVVENRRLKGNFQEFMELNQFPFDTQDITISVTSERSDKEVVILEDVNDCCTLNTDTFAGEQEWHLWKYVRTWRRTRTDDNKSHKTNHSAFSCACRVTRRPGFFIWNILVVMFLICGLSFATFAVSHKLPQNRLQLAFFLVLTTVSFKFTVNQSLPMIAYLTYMDKYILSTMGILMCICVWHAVVPLMVGEGYMANWPQWADTVALMVFGAVYIGFHLAYALIIVYVVRSVKKDSEEHERRQAEKMAKCLKSREI